MQLSIIVPVYNSSKYLEKCLASICIQLCNIHELIIINDNSSDNSGTILSRFSNTHRNIKLITNKNNIGPGASRNTGLNIAKGKYITFIDSDDYISENYFSSLINNIEDKKAEIVFSDYKLTGKNSDTNQTSTFMKNNDISWEKMVASAWSAPWGKLYRSEFIYKNKLHFNSQSIIGEDIQFSWLAYIFCKNAIVSSDTCYYYRQNTNGCDQISDNRVFGIISALNSTKMIYESYYASGRHDELLLHMLIKNLSYNSDKLSSTDEKLKFIKDSKFLLDNFDQSLVEKNRYLTKYEKRFFKLYMNI